jgi:ribosomal protein S18 acetylase RimI-like enzyme
MSKSGDIRKAMNCDILIRPATIDDREFILSLIPRLVEFGPPHWRNPEQMTATDIQTLDTVLSTNPPETVVLIAENSDRERLGFIHLRAEVDYFSREKTGYVSDIIVTRQGEGNGVGRALMNAAEDWSRNQGYSQIALHAFVQNARARKLYESLGYGPDLLKYVKEL